LLIIKAESLFVTLKLSNFKKRESVALNNTIALALSVPFCAVVNVEKKKRRIVDKYMNLCMVYIIAGNEQGFAQVWN